MVADRARSQVEGQSSQGLDGSVYSTENKGDFIRNNISKDRKVHMCIYMVKAILLYVYLLLLLYALEDASQDVPK